MARRPSMWPFIYSPVLSCVPSILSELNSILLVEIIRCIQSSLCCTLCKNNPACLNFCGLAPASLSNQPQPAKSAIFAKIGRKMINLARLFLHNGVHSRICITAYLEPIVVLPRLLLHLIFAMIISPRDVGLRKHNLAALE